MTLKDRIEQRTKELKALRKDLKQAREEKWDAAYQARNDARREGESEQHWEARRERNRERYEHKDKVTELLAKKLAHWEKELDDLREHRQAEKEERAEERSSGYEKGSSKIVTFDCKPCVEDLAYWLDKARDNGWGGYLVSGYRSPAYSQQLCYGICGAKSCPGRCAGVTSNHTKTSYPGPAGDVTDYINCERVLAKIGAPYRNNLPLDLVHMSQSGY